MAAPKGKRPQLTEAQKAARLAERNATFKKLAARRLANARKQIALLGNLASYKPSEAQVKFLFEELSKAAQSAHARFTPSAKGAADEIVIPD